MKKNAAKRGISIAEAVIAMALISVIAASSFTAIASSIKVTTRTFARYDSINLIGNCLECFKYSKDPGQYTITLEFFGENPGDGDYNAVIIGNSTLYIFEEKAYTVIVYINWTGNTFNATSVSSSGDTLYTFGKQDEGFAIPYTKGS
jgi:type II secretory pathway pseudopilin PulG